MFYYDKLDVVVLGSIGIDTNIYLYGNEVDFEVECNFSQNMDYIGQAGGYCSRGFQSLGKKTGFIGYIGEDHNGEFIKTELEKDRIQTLYFNDPLGTKRSVNFMYKDGRRKNFFDGKASMDVSPDISRCRKMLEKTELAHFNIANWTRHLLPLARELDMKISCDIQDISDINDPYREDFINYADVLFFSSTNFSDPYDIIKAFLAKNQEQIIVVGQGSKGCILGTKGQISYFPSIDLPGEIIDTNGAGDGLATGFLASYFIDRYGLEDSILRGQIMARYTCTQKADSANLLSMEQMDEYYKMLK